MNLYKQFETSPSLECAGINIEYGNNSNEKMISFKIARAGGSNAAFIKCREAKLKPHRRMIQMGTMDQGLLENLIMEAFATTVLLGWEGVEDREGKALPFTPTNAIALFRDLPDLYLDLQEQSLNAMLFRNEVIQADVKN
jgi:hypothetical protein